MIAWLIRVVLLWSLAGGIAYLGGWEYVDGIAVSVNEEGEKQAEALGEFLGFRLPGLLHPSAEVQARQESNELWRRFPDLRAGFLGVKMSDSKKWYGVAPSSRFFEFSWGSWALLAIATSCALWPFGIQIIWVWLFNVGDE